MSSDVKLFEKEEFGKVRVVMQGADPWFVGKDVCECLGLENVSEALRGLDEDEKITLSNPDGNPKAGIPHQMNVISESGLYSLILRSRKPEAKAFKRWVTHEVLPSIRKTGHYGEWNLPRIPKSFPDALRMIADIEEEKQLAIEQRDYYRRTKAEIGSRREATAMNTASVLSKQNDKLRTEIGDSRTWKQVKALPWFLEVFIDVPAAYSVAGRKLSELSRRLGYEIREVEDSRFGSVKAYHADVITAFRVALRDDLNMMRKYRR